MSDQIKKLKFLSYCISFKTNICFISNWFLQFDKGLYVFNMVMYLVYLSIIIVFQCFFSLPYLFSKWTNKILQENYKQEFSGRPDMTFSCKQKQNSNHFEISHRSFLIWGLCKASWVFKYSIKSSEFSGAAKQ